MEDTTDGYLFNKTLCLVTTSLSIAGNIYVIYQHSKLGTKQNIFHMQAIFLLQINDLLQCSSGFLIVALSFIKQLDTWKQSVYSISCAVSAYFNLVFDLGAFILVSIISYNLYKFIVRKKHEANTYFPDKLLQLFCCIYFIPLLISLPPLFTGNYLPQAPDPSVHCWIAYEGFSTQSHNLVGTIEIILLDLVPWLATSIWVAYATIKIQIALKSTVEHHNQDESLQTFYKSLIWYPIILFICWIPIQIKRIVEIAHPETIVPNIFQNISIPVLYLQGFCNSIVYGYVTLPILEKTEFDQIISQSSQADNVSGPVGLQNQNILSNSQANQMTELSQEKSINSIESIQEQNSLQNQNQLLPIEQGGQQQTKQETQKNKEINIVNRNDSSTFISLFRNQDIIQQDNYQQGQLLSHLLNDKKSQQTNESFI